MKVRVLGIVEDAEFQRRFLQRCGRSTPAARGAGGDIRLAGLKIQCEVFHVFDLGRTSCTGRSAKQFRVEPQNNSHVFFSYRYLTDFSQRSGSLVAVF